VRIAIIKLSALGDIVHAMVVLQFIKKAHPDARIDWVVEEAFVQILQNNPHIDTILPLNLKSIKKHKRNLLSEIKKVKTYAQKGYDVVIDAQGLLKSAIVAKLIASQTSVIVGFDKYSIREKMASWFYDTKVSIAYEQNVIIRNMTLIAKALSINLSIQDILDKEPFLYTDSTFEQKDYILFVVGASKANKIYPKEKFLELAKTLNEEITVVWGNETEKQSALWLKERCNNITLSPKGDLEALKALIGSAKLVIGGDTGPTHLAWAMNIPSVALFGNTPALRNSFATSINQTIQSNSNVNALRLNKNDFSIESICPNDIVNLSKKILSY